jgi:hypothetical protein
VLLFQAATEAGAIWVADLVKLELVVVVGHPEFGALLLGGYIYLFCFQVKLLKWGS